MYGDWKALRADHRRNRVVSGPSQMVRRQFTRDQARQICKQGRRDMGLWEGIRRRMLELVLGKRGPRIQCVTADQAFNRKVEQLWDAWWNGPEGESGCDLREQHRGPALIRMMLTEWCDCGASTTLTVARSPGEVGALQLIEDERVRNEASQPDYVGPEGGMYGGIETDARGRMVAAHIASYAGSSSRPYGFVRTPPRDVTRFEARNVVYAMHPGEHEAGVWRPMPALIHLVEPMLELDSFLEASMTAASLAAEMGVVVTGKDPTGQRAALEGTKQDAEDNPRNEDSPSIFGGAFPVHFFEQGDAMNVVKPEHPTTTFKEFAKTYLELGLAPLPMNVAMLLLDVEGLSWSSGKVMMSMLEGSLAPDRQQVETMMCRFFWFRVLEAARLGELDGVLGEPDTDTHDRYGMPLGWDRPKFQHDPLPDPDPEKTAKVDKLAIDSGLEAAEDVAARRGQDWPEHVEKIARNQREKAESGFVAVVAGATGMEAREGPKEIGEEGGGVAE